VAPREIAGAINWYIGDCWCQKSRNLAPMLGNSHLEEVVGHLQQVGVGLTLEGLIQCSGRQRDVGRRTIKIFATNRSRFKL
jgi:hypothetical protein